MFIISVFRCEHKIMRVEEANTGQAVVFEKLKVKVEDDSPKQPSSNRESPAPSSPASASDAVPTSSPVLCANINVASISCSITSTTSTPTATAGSESIVISRVSSVAATTGITVATDAPALTARTSGSPSSDHLQSLADNHQETTTTTISFPYKIEPESKSKIKGKQKKSFYVDIFCCSNFWLVYMKHQMILITKVYSYM